MFRKESVKIVFDKLKRILKENKETFQEVKNMEFSDFMFLCCTIIEKESALFGFLQSQMAIPLQIYQ